MPDGFLFPSDTESYSTRFFPALQALSPKKNSQRGRAQTQLRLCISRKSPLTPRPLHHKGLCLKRSRRRIYSFSFLFLGEKQKPETKNETVGAALAAARRATILIRKNVRRIRKNLRIRRTFLCYLSLIPPGGHKGLPCVCDPGLSQFLAFCSRPPRFTVSG